MGDNGKHGHDNGKYAPSNGNYGPINGNHGHGHGKNGPGVDKYKQVNDGIRQKFEKFGQKFGHGYFGPNPHNPNRGPKGHGGQPVRNIYEVVGPNIPIFDVHKPKDSNAPSSHHKGGHGK